MLSAVDAPSAAKLAEILEDFLTAHPAAALLQDGRVLFDMRLARYSITESHGRCLLQFWSEERNLMRTVVEIQPRVQYLRVITSRMGAGGLSMLMMNTMRAVTPPSPKST